MTSESWIAASMCGSKPFHCMFFFFFLLALTTKHLCSSCRSLNTRSDLKLYICVSVPEPAVASCVQRPVDVVFMLDGSERMGLENHRRAKEFIENIARRLTLASGQADERNARFALLQYGSPTEQRVAFPLTHNLTVISDSLAAVNYMDSSSALGSAIIYAVNNVVTSGVHKNANISTGFPAKE